jgi:hypothetical protein
MVAAEVRSYPGAAETQTTRRTGAVQLCQKGRIIMNIPEEFKGFLALLIKWIAPRLTDENVLKAAAWLVRELLKRAVSDPEKAQAIIDQAQEFVFQVNTLLDMVEAGDVPASLR